MQNLIKQERFELEVLDRLNSAKLLGGLVFGGGTMLRLCYGLNRFSVDLDFWVVKKIEFEKMFKEIEAALSAAYTITDAADKFNTLLFEMRSRDYPRLLKIEIRKEAKKISIEQAIAYSRYSNTQVLINIVSLKDMMSAKIEAFLDRKEIRDAFDIEFLLKKGIALEAPQKTREHLLKIILSFTKKDYTAKLGSLLEERERKYYAAENFKILKESLK